MFRVEAVTAAALTSAPLPKTTPLLLTKITWPLALIAPLMTDADPLVTRFKVTALLLG